MLTFDIAIGDFLEGTGMPLTLVGGTGLQAAFRTPNEFWDIGGTPGFLPVLHFFQQDRSGSLQVNNGLHVWITRLGRLADRTSSSMNSIASTSSTSSTFSATHLTPYLITRSTRIPLESDLARWLTTDST